MVLWSTFYTLGDCCENVLRVRVVGDVEQYMSDSWYRWPGVVCCGSRDGLTLASLEMTFLSTVP